MRAVMDGAGYEVLIMSHKEIAEADDMLLVYSVPTKGLVAKIFFFDKLEWVCQQYYGRDALRTRLPKKCLYLGPTYGSNR